MSSSFFGIFGSSPFKPLQAHMQTVQATALSLVDFIEACFEGQWDKAEQAHEDISEQESQADIQKKDIRLHLPKSLFMPVSRTDLLRLLAAQDKIANKAKDISGLLFGRRLVFPESVQREYSAFLNCCCQTIEQAMLAVGAFDELLETGFKGHEVSLVENMVLTLDTLEDESDRLQRNLRASLYRTEQSLSPVDAIFLYQVIQWTGDLADHAQHAGHCLELLVAR